MKKRNLLLLTITGILLLAVVLLFALPIPHSFPKDINQAEIGVIFIQGDIKTQEYTVPAWDIETQTVSYSIKEKEGLDVKERITSLLQSTRYYRTPATIYYNLTNTSPTKTGSTGETLNIIYHSEDTVTTITLWENLIAIDGNYYSLGWNGTEKSNELIKELHTLLADAKEYLEK